MEGVVTKVCRDLKWAVHIQVAKHGPHLHTHPSRRIGREITNVMRQIIAPIEEQLREDTTWKE